MLRHMLRHMLRFPPAPSFTSVRRILAGLILVTSIPALGSAATIRPDGLLQVDGNAMFPIGLVELGTYAYEDWDDRIQSTGANVVWDIEIAYADTVPTCASIFEAADEGNYYLLIGSGDTFNWDNPSTPELEVDRHMYEPLELDELLECAGSNMDRILGFANRDEPVWTLSRNQIGDIDAEHIHETYSQLHAAQPQTLVAMNFAPAHLSRDAETWKADIREFTDATDVMMFAGYPYPQGPGTCGDVNVLGYPECKMDRILEAADVFLSEINDPGQPLWMVIQGFKEIPLKEARWQAYGSIIHGATGLYWGGWTWTHWLGNGSDTWPVTQQVMSEISQLHPWLVGTDFPGVTSDNPDVEVRALEHEGQITVLAISRNGYEGPATILLPDLARRRVDVPFEDRKLNADNSDHITDTFDAYEGHVYRYTTLHGSRASRNPAVDAPDVEAALGPFAMSAFPNPSAGRTQVRFQMPQAGTAVFTVFDAAGRRVATVGRGNYNAGSAEVTWSGRDVSGKPVAPGVYFVQGRTSNGEEASARVLIRH